MNVLTTPRERRIMPVILALLIVALIVASPLLTILALNTLGLSVPYTFGTWLAVLWLHIVMADRGDS